MKLDGVLRDIGKTLDKILPLIGVNLSQKKLGVFVVRIVVLELEEYPAFEKKIQRYWGIELRIPTDKEYQ